jgi:hypothetical protein
MTKGVETLYHNVYTQYTEIILQSQIFASNVKGGMSVIAAKVFQDYENLKDAFNSQISRNHNALASIATILRERRDDQNTLAARLETQRTQMDENKKTAVRAMATVQNTQ